MLTTLVYTLLALLAFAGNSVICRLALGDNQIDAASFTAIRLFSGIIMLMILLALLPNKMKPVKSPCRHKKTWFSAITLFLYALCFSFAYISLDTGTGALILFSAVQITMVIISIYQGEKLHSQEWAGLFLALIGFTYFVLPSVESPSFIGLVLMTLSGVSWGIYSLIGRKSQHPLQDTYHNFLLTLPLLLVLMIFTLDTRQFEISGLWLAIMSGAITSGLGYAIWYMALPRLSAGQASTVQLSVPILATIGGIIFNDELFSKHLAISGLIILSGIILVTMKKSNG